MGQGTLKKPRVAVIGAGDCSPETAEVAAEVGRGIARHGAVLVCGGLGGVMLAAARGAKEAGGVTLGILPGPSAADANPYIDYPVVTNMGHARNMIIAHTADVLISVAGGYGTVSETAIALKLGKTVIALEPAVEVPGVKPAKSPQDALGRAMEALGL
jgi:hypothetical protein